MKIYQKAEKLVIDVQGVPGRCGDNGEDGINGIDGITNSFYRSCGTAAGDGENGARGENGLPGEDLTLTLRRTDTGVSVLAYSSSESKNYSRILSSQSRIVIHAGGGSGGHGGEGGRGGHGGRGAKGRPASSCLSGGNGTRGGNGGHGGNGGDGGDGAQSGNVTLRVGPDETDLLLMLQAMPVPRGGRGGNPGKAGKGGRFGAGGRGGEDYDGYTTYTVRGQPWEGSREYRQPRHIPGGISGCDGKPGECGSEGLPGKKGRDGVLQIIVNDVVYPGCYDLELDSLVIKPSEDGIYEPGEIVSVSAVFRNTGCMPIFATPPVMISIVDNDWISGLPESVVKIEQVILPGATVKLDEAFSFQIKSLQEPLVKGPLHEKADIAFKAVFFPQGLTFPRLHNKYSKIDVCYPYTLSSVYMPERILAGGEAPFVFKVTNFTSETTQNKRKVCVSIEEEKTEGASLDLYDLRGNFVQSLCNPYFFEINNLLPECHQWFDGFYKFQQPVKPFAEAKLRYTLFLENDKNVLKPVQVITSTLHAAEECVMDDSTQILLVTTRDTPRKQIEKWRVFAKELGGSLAVWDASLKQGLSYSLADKQGISLREKMQRRVVVILNSDRVCLYDGSKQFPVRFLQEREIFDAACEQAVGTYVVGGPFDMEKAVRPVHRPETSIPVYKNSWLPGRKTLPKTDPEKICSFFAKQKLQQNPVENYLPVYQKMKEPVNDRWHFVRQKWLVLTLEMRKGLDRNKPMIAYRQSAAHTVDSVDHYAVIRLFSFEKKLSLFRSMKSDTVSGSVVHAIVDDLKDEISCYARRMACGQPLKDQEIDKCMENLCSFVDVFPRLVGEKRKLFLKFLLDYVGYIKKISHQSSCAGKRLFGRIKHLMETFFQNKDQESCNIFRKLKDEKDFYVSESCFTAVHHVEWSHQKDLSPVESEKCRDGQPIRSFFDEKYCFFNNVADRKAYIEFLRKNPGFRQ